MHIEKKVAFGVERSKKKMYFYALKLWVELCVGLSELFHYGGFAATRGEGASEIFCKTLNFN